jgi:hypothetical protein
MIGRREASKAAGRELQGAVVRGDPGFASFAAASLGEPQLVHDLARRPSYWVVPVEHVGRVIGFIRITATGGVAAVGSFCRDPSSLADCPLTITHISARQARQRAAARINAAAGEVAEFPIYVHDGPPGREAWLVETNTPGRPRRRIFVTAAEAYERPEDPSELAADEGE